MREFDVVLSQEMVRGSLNATIAGRLMDVPVVTYLGIAPVEYWRCRRERLQVGPIKAALGEAFIRFAMAVSGRFATTALGMGPYLRDVAGITSSHAEVGCYYGVDTDCFKPVTESERRVLRERHTLPSDRFIIFFPSRISHEKDPETVLRAAAKVRERGLDALVLNLGGGYQDFLRLANQLGLADADGMDCRASGRASHAGALRILSGRGCCRAVVACRRRGLLNAWRRSPLALL